MAFRRCVLEQIGGFDDRVGPGTRFSGDDVVAVAKALWHGVAAKYDPKPTVHHHHGRNTKEQLDRRLRAYSVGRGAYYAIFIANPASRRIYLLEFGKRIVAEFLMLLRGLVRGRWYPMHNSIQEIRGAITFTYEGRRGLP